MLTSDRADATRPPARSPLPAAPREAVERACALIAPAWPLDRLIAVNPLWPWTDRPLPEVAAEVAALSGAQLLMPRAWYAEEWRAGRLGPAHLREAIAEAGASVSEDRLRALLQAPEPPAARRPLVVDVADARPGRELEMGWRDFVIQRTSQHLAAYFDDGQAQLGPDRQGGLYASWRRQALGDHGPALLMGRGAYRAVAATLPGAADEMIGLALSELAVPPGEQERYLTALLLDLNGWASSCAYLRFTARLRGRDDDHIVELLAIRCAWEWLVHRLGDEALRADWRRAVARWPALDRAARAARAEDWLLQRAVEIAWQEGLCRGLPEGLGAARPEAPRAQAVFCIDVRSEVLRRALEAPGGQVQTLGFAGFFGLPIEYAPLGAAGARPQLPGPLSPRYRVTDDLGDVENGDEGAALAARRRARLAAAQALSALRSSPLSSFAYVEALGLYYAGKLAADLLGAAGAAAERAGLSRRQDEARRPRLKARVDGAPLPIEERCQIAEGMLRAMGLARGLARLVLLVGHGAQSANNPQAAGLDCGACCGQTGEVNARAAAALLNDEEVRRGLRGRGVEIPASTRFVAALHNTTTDEVQLFEEGALPATHRADLDELRERLARAGARARRERAPRLGLAGLPDGRLHAALRARARDWAEVRPEWGLAGNAAFIVAPRERSRHLDLGGRAFLHDYRSEEDPGFAILELIMTAPMIVTHWINLQYYASTVDNGRYGSGNKVLHNVVGGHLGVFEGNGGDLRVGLPLQSLHDGERWVHAPLRLSVLIEAPRPAIDGVLARHGKVRDLVEKQWLHLLQLDAAERAVFARRAGGWTRCATR